MQVEGRATLLSAFFGNPDLEGVCGLDKEHSMPEWTFAGFSCDKKKKAQWSQHPTLWTLMGSDYCCLPIVVCHCFFFFLNMLLLCVAHTCKMINIGFFRTSAALIAALRLTLSLGDGAADGGAGGGDGAHGGAHAIRGVNPGHGRRVGHPGSGVNGSDGFTCGIVDSACNEDRSYSS